MDRRERVSSSHMPDTCTLRIPSRALSVRTLAPQAQADQSRTSTRCSRLLPVLHASAPRAQTRAKGTGTDIGAFVFDEEEADDIERGHVDV